MRKEIKMEQPPLVTCRPAGGLGWAYASIFFVCGCGFLLLPAIVRSAQTPAHPIPPTDVSTWRLLGVIVVGLWSLAVWGAAHELRACILADATGLRWRDVGKWQMLGWDEITEVSIQPQARGHKQAVIRSKTKLLRVQDYSWQNIPALLDMVFHYAPAEVWHTKSIRG